MTQISSQFDSALQNANAQTGQAAFARQADATSKAAKIDPKLREQVGDFVGTIFYGTLLSQMQDSKIKGKYFHGGRGEDIFKGQLYMEYAKRIGRSPNDPMSNHIFESMTRHLKSQPTNVEPTSTNTAASGTEQKGSRAA